MRSWNLVGVVVRRAWSHCRSVHCEVFLCSLWRCYRIQWTEMITWMWWFFFLLYLIFLLYNDEHIRSNRCSDESGSVMNSVFVPSRRQTFFITFRCCHMTNLWTVGSAISSVSWVPHIIAEQLFSLYIPLALKLVMTHNAVDVAIRRV